MSRGKRSDPARLLKERQKIVADMESRLPKDAEDPESAIRREKASPPPRRRGALVTGFKKPNNTA